MKDTLSTVLTKTPDGVWVYKDPTKNFGYTDGAWVEKYLTNAFNNALDLSCGSPELEAYIHEWNTEYHLTPKRMNLLDNLTYNSEHTVLEIGCGCGAITRFLGETFKQVVAVEGSYDRACLARLRTRDLESVEVVNARFQDISNDNKFDAIFCIGVWEYSPSYVEGENPFEAALDAMKSRLKPGGYLVLAIENQLGLKYFAKSREDHAGIFFEGIEGYPRMHRRFMTFGRKDLEARLGSVGPSIDVYYPFPDYKVPDALLSEALLGKVNCGEMIGSMDERDYAGVKPAFFDTRLAWPVIAQNGLTADMANSFLVVVGGASKPSMGGALGFLYNTERRPEYRTMTRLTEDERGQIVATKFARRDGLTRTGRVAITHESSHWLDGESVALSTYRALHDRYGAFGAAMNDVRLWWEKIQRVANDDGMLPGNYIDLTWQNAVVIDQNVKFYDCEFVWDQPIPAKLLLARAAFLWDSRYHSDRLLHLRMSTARARVRAMCSAVGVALSSEDFRQVLDLEARFQFEIGGGDLVGLARKLRLRLDFPHYAAAQKMLAAGRINFQRAKNLARRILGRSS